MRILSCTKPPLPMRAYIGACLFSYCSSGIKERSLSKTFRWSSAVEKGFGNNSLSSTIRALLNECGPTPGVSLPNPHAAMTSFLVPGSILPPPPMASQQSRRRRISAVEFSSSIWWEYHLTIAASIFWVLYKISNFHGHVWHDSRDVWSRGI